VFLEVGKHVENKHIAVLL